jgi:hypothetical protein
MRAKAIGMVRAVSSCEFSIGFYVRDPVVGRDRDRPRLPARESPQRRPADCVLAARGFGVGHGAVMTRYFLRGRMRVVRFAGVLVVNLFADAARVAFDSRTCRR